MEPGKCTTLYLNINVQSIYILNISLKNYNSFPVHQDDIPAELHKGMTNDEIKTNQIKAMETSHEPMETDEQKGYYIHYNVNKI